MLRVVFTLVIAVRAGAQARGFLSPSNESAVSHGAAVPFANESLTSATPSEGSFAVVDGVKCVPMLKTIHVEAASASTCQSIAVGDCLKVNSSFRAQIDKLNGTIAALACGRIIQIGKGTGDVNCDLKVARIDAANANGQQRKPPPTCPPGQVGVRAVSSKKHKAYITGRGIGKIPSKCPHGYEDEGLFCGVKCPPHFTNLGLSCAKPKPYGRGAGTISKHHCLHHHADEGCQKWGLLWYPKCRASFHHVACCICSPDCPAHTTDIGEVCIKKAKKTRCPDSHPSMDAGLCYKDCPTWAPYQFGLLCAKTEAVRDVLIGAVAVGTVVALYVADMALEEVVEFFWPTEEVDFGAAIPVWERPIPETTVVDPSGVYPLSLPWV